MPERSPALLICKRVTTPARCCRCKAAVRVPAASVEIVRKYGRVELLCDACLPEVMGGTER